MVDFGSSDYFHAMDAPKKQIGNMHVKEFGISAKIGDVLQAFKADLSTGAKHVELVFAGIGKGSLQGNTNPEMFDKVKREEIRQLAKINGVTVSTHAAVQMAGFSGFDPQRGNAFDEGFRQSRLQEIKRTIEFAADAAGGGAVVLHTGEFPRSVKDPKFKIGSKEQEPLYLADPKTGDILWKEGGLTYNDFAKEIKEWNDKYPHQEKRLPEKEFLFLQSFQQIQAEQPRVLEYERGSRKMEEEYKELKGKVESWKALEAKTPPEKKDYLLQAFRSEFGKELAHEMDKTKKNPSQILEEYTHKIKEEAVRLREGYLGFQKNVKNLQNQFETIKPIEEIGLKKTAETFAEAAMYAYRLEKQKKLDKAVFIAPENMFAEYGYGGHPDELRTIVQESRKAMVEKLEKTFGIKGKEAKKIADDHIKATFDAGHANTWAKYFEEDPKLSPEENKKKFDTWLVGEVKKLRDDGILGNVHLSDNFGYQDEHLNVGGGNAPLRELVELFRDKKYEGKIVVEWGAQGPEEQQEAGALLSAWANLAGSPIYRVEGVSPRWSDIENGGYFGASSSPFHVSGAYGAGLSKDWRLWSYSEAPIE